MIWPAAAAASEYLSVPVYTSAFKYNLAIIPSAEYWLILYFTSLVPKD